MDLFLTAVLRHFKPQAKLPSGTWIWVSLNQGENPTGQWAGKGRGVAPLSWATSIPVASSALWFRVQSQTPLVAFSLGLEARPRWMPFLHVPRCPLGEQFYLPWMMPSFQPCTQPP